MSQCWALFFSDQIGSEFWSASSGTPVITTTKGLASGGRLTDILPFEGPLSHPLFGCVAGVIGPMMLCSALVLVIVFGVLLNGFSSILLLDTMV